MKLTFNQVMHLLVFLVGAGCLAAGVWMIQSGIKADGKIEIHLKELLGGSIESGSAGLLFSFFGFILVMFPLVLYREKKAAAPAPTKPASNKYKVLVTIVLILWAIVITCIVFGNLNTDKAAADGYAIMVLFFFAIAFIFSIGTLYSWLEYHDRSNS